MNINPQIIKGCKKQDRKAQSELYRLCFNVLMGVCIRYMRNEPDAVSVLNLGFLKILNNLDKHKPNVPFDAWIRRIMINTIIDEFRKSKKHREHMEYTDFEKGAYHEHFVDVNAADSKFDAEALEELIQQLPPVSRKVFNLYAIDGYTHKEIGKMLNISDGTSKWHLSFARKKLREMLTRVTQALPTLLL